MQYLVEKTAAQVNATDNVSYSNVALETVLEVVLAYQAS